MMEPPLPGLLADEIPEFEPALPLAAPARPLILGDTAVRIALVRDDAPEKPVALELNFAGEDALVAASRLVPGRIEIALTSGFGRTRQIQLSPAEFMLILAYGDRFFQELPR